MAMPGLPSPAMKHGDSGVWIGKSKVTINNGSGTPVPYTITYPMQSAPGVATPSGTGGGTSITEINTPGTPDVELNSSLVSIQAALIDYDGTQYNNIIATNPEGEFEDGQFKYRITNVFTVNGEEFTYVIITENPVNSPLNLYYNYGTAAIVKSNVPGSDSYQLAKNLMANLANGNLKQMDPYYILRDSNQNYILDNYGQTKIFQGEPPSGSDYTALNWEISEGKLGFSCWDPIKQKYTTLHSTAQYLRDINSENIFSHDQVTVIIPGTPGSTRIEVSGNNNLGNIVSAFSTDTIREYQDMAQYGRTAAERQAAQAWLNQNVKRRTYSPYTKTTSEIRNKYTDLKGENAVKYYKDVAKNSTSSSDRANAKAWLKQHEITISESPYTKTTSEIRNKYTDLKGENAVKYYKDVARNSTSGYDRANAKAWLAQFGNSPIYMALFSKPVEGKITYSLKNTVAGMQGSEAIDYYTRVATKSTSEASRLAAKAWLATYAETPEYTPVISKPVEGKITYSSKNTVAGMQGSEAIDYYTQVATKSTSEASRLAAKAWLATYAETPGYETKKESPTPAMITLSTELGDDIIVTPTKNTSSEEWINILKAASELNGIDGMQGEEAVRFYELMKKYAPNYLNQNAAGSWLSTYAGTSGHPLYDKDAYENTAFDYKGIIYDSKALYNTGEFHPLATSLTPKIQYRETVTPEEGMTKAEMIAAQEAVGTTSIIESPQQQYSLFDMYLKNTPLYSIYQAGSTLADYLGIKDEYSKIGQITYDFAKQKVKDINVQDVGDKIAQTVISVSPLGPMFAAADLSKNLTGKNTDLTVTKSDLREAKNELSSIETGIKNQETVVTSLEPQASKMQSELQTIYDKNVKDGVWMGSEADLQKFNQLSTEYAPTLEKYNDEVKKYDSIIAEYTKQEKNYTDLSQKHTDELNDSSLLMGWYNTFSKNITPTVRDWARSATVDYLMVPTKNVLDAPSNALSVVGDITGSKEIKSAADIVKKGTDTIWQNPANISVYDFLYYGVRPIPEFASEIIGTTPAAIEYAYENPTDFASLFPEKLAEQTVGTGTYAIEHPAAFFGMLAVPTVWKGVKAIPREVSKLSPGFDRTSVWPGRYSLTDAVRGKATYGTWWEQYRKAQPPFREAMSNSLIDPFLATDILTGKKSVTRALSDVWKAGDGPGLKEYISPNRWKTTHYTPKTSAKQMVELADRPPRIEYSQFYDSKHPLGPEMVKTRATSFGDHATGNVVAESAAIEGKFLVNSGKSSLLESGLFLGVEKTLAPFLEHDYPAVIRVKAPVWEYSQKVRDLINKVERYDSEIAAFEKKLKKEGLSNKEALKYQEMLRELAELEKVLQKQVDLEFAAAPENVLIPGPKPTSRRAYHGELQEEFILKDGSELFRSENWRTNLYDRFGLTRGTKYGYDPKSLQKYEIMEFTTEKPKSGTPGQKPSAWFDIPEFQKNLFYTPAYRSIIYGIKGAKSAIESPIRQIREARAEREILSKIDDPETKAAAKATIDTIRDIRGMKSAISLDIDLAALKEVGPELAGQLSELFQKHRVVLYGSGVNLATIPKEMLWRELKDADLFIPREEAASFLVDAKKMFKKLGWDVKQDGLQVLSKEGKHLLDIHEAPIDYPLIGGKGMKRDPYTNEVLTPVAADFMPTRLETGEIFVRESLVTQAQRKLNSMLDQFYEGKFKPNRAKDYPDGIFTVEILLDTAEGKINTNFFKAGYNQAKTIAEKARWEKIADEFTELSSKVKKHTIDKLTEAKIQRIRGNIEIIKNHSYVKPLYEAALNKGAVYRLDNFEQLLREVNEAEFSMGIIRERGGYLDLTTGLSRLSKIGEEYSISYSPKEAGIKLSETGSVLDYHTHPLDSFLGRYDTFSTQDIKSFLLTDTKQGAVVTGGETYMFTKGPKTSAKIQKVIDYKFDPITRENIQNLGPVEKLSKYIDNYVTDLRETYAGELYKVILKSEPNLSPQQFLNRINSGTGSYARYRGVIFNQIIQDLAEKFGCKIEESTFGRAFHRTNIKWDENTGAIADIDLAYLSPNAVRRSESAFEALETRKKPRALINVGYAPSPSRGAGRGTGISSAITELMQASVIGKNYMQQSPDPTTGKISYDIAKPAKSPDSRSAAREIQNVMTSTIDLTQPLTRYDTAPKFAKSRKPTKHSTAPKQQQTEISPSIYPTRTAPASRRQAPYSYDQIRPHPSSPRIVVNYSYSDPRRERDLSYVFGNYNYDYPNRSYKFDPYSYNYDFPPNKTSIPEIPTFITGGDNPFWRRHKDESVQQDRQNLKKYHKYTEITGGATAGQAMNFIWGNSTAFYQKMLRTQGAGEEGKLTVDKKSTKKSSAKNSKSSLHPILFESLI